METKRVKIIADKEQLDSIGIDKSIKILEANWVGEYPDGIYSKISIRYKYEYGSSQFTEDFGILKEYYEFIDE